MRAPLSRAAIAALALGVLGTAACRDDRASVTEPFGSVAYNARLLPAPQGIPAASYSYSDTGDETVNGDVAAAPTLVYKFTGLDSLVGTNVYQVFSGVEGGTLVPATGKLYVVKADTTIDPATGDPIVTETTTTQDNVSSFQNGGTNITVYLAVTDAAVGDPGYASTDFALVTIEAAPGATTPTTTGPRPLWGRLNESTSFTFGTYDPENEMPYVATGRGYARFRDNIIMVDDSALVRPPVGYYYETHIVARSAGTVDEAASLNLGAQTAPAPRRSVSLYDADVSIVDPVVLPTSIRAAANRASVDTIPARAGTPNGFPFAGLAEIVVTLEAKAGRPEVRSPTIILAGTTPVEVSVPPVTSGSTR